MTQWTQEQYEELSKKVAEKFSIPGCKVEWADDIHFTLWLHNNWMPIMDLCVEHGIWARHTKDGWALAYFKNGHLNASEHSTRYETHNNDKSLAERVARMLALMEVQM